MLTHSTIKVLHHSTSQKCVTAFIQGFNRKLDAREALWNRMRTPRQFTIVTPTNSSKARRTSSGRYVLGQCRSVLGQQWIAGQMTFAVLEWWQIIEAFGFLCSVAGSFCHQYSLFINLMPIDNLKIQLYLNIKQKVSLYDKLN